MKKNLLIAAGVLTVIGLLPLNTVSVSAEPDAEGICGDSLTWTYDAASATLRISGEGEMYDYGYFQEDEGIESPPWSPDMLWNDGTSSKVIVEEGVTSIGANAFNDKPIYAVELPTSLRTIGSEAFGHAPIESLVLPTGLERIEEFAFTGIGVSELVIPDTVQFIGDDAFSYSNIKSIQLPEGLSEISEGCFFFSEELEKITLPESVAKINDAAFWYCFNLKEITVLNPECEFGMAFEQDGEFFLPDVIYGYENSTAQAYAEKNNLTFRSLTDSDPEQTTPAEQEVPGDDTASTDPAPASGSGSNQTSGGNEDGNVPAPKADDFGTAAPAALLLAAAAAVLVGKKRMKT